MITDGVLYLSLECEDLEREVGRLDVLAERLAQECEEKPSLVVLVGPLYVFE